MNNVTVNYHGQQIPVVITDEYTDPAGRFLATAIDRLYVQRVKTGA